MRESKKVNKQYRRFAIEALGTFLDGFPDVDYYTEVKAMLFSVLDDEDDMDADDDAHDKPLQLMVMASAAKALGMTWTRNEQFQSECAYRYLCSVTNKRLKEHDTNSADPHLPPLGQHSAEFVAQVSKALVRNVWNVRAALLETLEKFWVKLDLSPSPSVISEESILLMLDSLLEGSLRDYKYITLRNQGLQLLKLVIGKVKGTYGRYYRLPSCFHDRRHHVLTNNVLGFGVTG